MIQLPASLKREINFMGFLLGDGIDSIDDPRQVTKDGQHKADPEFVPAAELEEDAEWREEDGYEDVDAVGSSVVGHGWLLIDFSKMRFFDGKKIDSENKPGTMRCITSAEDMIDYLATSLVAKINITARSTDNSIQLGGNVLIGEVKAANGGKLGHVVSCHQAAFPYLLYRCHSVPETKLYEVEILDPETKAKISAATAICHFDTSVWSRDHVAFMALGYERGMEICQWVFPGAIAWTAATE